MRGLVSSITGVLVGASLAWVSIYGLVSSQTDNSGPSPANAEHATIDYGSNG